jgi:hypothetical protein
VTAPEVGVPRDVFEAWAGWLAAGETARVSADLADLLAKTTPEPAEPGPEPAPAEPEAPPPAPGRDRPSYPAAPPISTR